MTVDGNSGTCTEEVSALIEKCAMFMTDAQAREFFKQIEENVKWQRQKRNLPLP